MRCATLLINSLDLVVGTFSLFDHETLLTRQHLCKYLSTTQLHLVFTTNSPHFPYPRCHNPSSIKLNLILYLHLQCPPYAHPCINTSSLEHLGVTLFYLRNQHSKHFANIYNAILAPLTFCKKQQRSIDCI